MWQGKGCIIYREFLRQLLSGLHTLKPLKTKKNFPYKPRFFLAPVHAWYTKRLGTPYPTNSVVISANYISGTVGDKNEPIRLWDKKVKVMRWYQISWKLARLKIDLSGEGKLVEGSPSRAIICPIAITYYSCILASFLSTGCWKMHYLSLWIHFVSCRCSVL